jgi:hypothetical protein
MKTGYVRFLSAFLGLATLAAAARAQAVDKIIVNIPYDFVAAGATLPAGTYTIQRASDGDFIQLSINSYENHAGVLLLSTEVSETREDKPRVSFQQVGDQHFLSRIETADHIFTIAVPSKSAPVVAKNQTSPSTSGSSGSN